MRSGPPEKEPNGGVPVMTWAREGMVMANKKATSRRKFFAQFSLRKTQGSFASLRMTTRREAVIAHLP
jgi:hypothetical protein